jgi:NAD(P)-dependent dehydrogenase (short-subunit alcohol dehydrogenase family)
MKTFADRREEHMAINCLGPFLLTQLLLPQLLAAAKTSPPASVRIVWTSSGVVDTNAAKGGINISDLTTPPMD